MNVEKLVRLLEIDSTLVESIKEKIPNVDQNGLIEIVRGCNFPYSPLMDFDPEYLDHNNAWDQWKPLGIHALVMKQHLNYQLRAGLEHDTIVKAFAIAYNVCISVFTTKAIDDLNNPDADPDPEKIGEFLRQCGQLSLMLTSKL